MANAFSRNTKDKTKLTIASADACRDGKKHEVIAHYNPKEIEVTKSIPWQKHPQSKADEPWLEFTGAEGRTMTMELLFDAYEDGGTIATELNSLGMMAKVKQDDGPENDRRPPILLVQNGPWDGVFKCVLESLSIKVTMFNNDNQPVRATVNVKFKEASKFEVKDQPAAAGGGA